MRESRRDSFEVDGDPENDAFLAFSVTFNNSSILEFLDLLQSVFQQQYQDFEVILLTGKKIGIID